MGEWINPGGQVPKPSTLEERLVIVWVLIFVLLLVGGICLYFGFTAAPAKAVQAGQVRLYGYGFVAAAVLVWVVYRVVGWVLDRRGF